MTNGLFLITTVAPTTGLRPLTPATRTDACYSIPLVFFFTTIPLVFESYDHEPDAWLVPSSNGPVHGRSTKTLEQNYTAHQAADIGRYSE